MTISLPTQIEITWPVIWKTWLTLHFSYFVVSHYLWMMKLKRHHASAADPNYSNPHYDKIEVIVRTVARLFCGLEVRVIEIAIWFIRRVLPFRLVGRICSSVLFLGVVQSEYTASPPSFPIGTLNTVDDVGYE